MTAGKLAAVATSAAVAIGYASQEQPRFTSSTAAVIVDVVVRDNAGRPVTNLSADDFEILEGGTRQAVKTFQFVDHSRPAATAAPAKALATTSQAAPAASLVEAPTVTALVFEQLGASGRRLAYRPLSSMSITRSLEGTSRASSPWIVRCTLWSLIRTQ